MKGKIKTKYLTYLFSILAMASLAYYSYRYYLDSQLILLNEDAFEFSIIVAILIMLLIRLVCIENKLDKVLMIMGEMQEQLDYNHDQNVKMHKGTRSFVFALNKKEDN